VRCVVLTDFDGTIVTIDTAEYALDTFASKEWRHFDEQLTRGEITFEESLVREFAMLKVSEKAMLDALEPATHFRPNFDRLIEYCGERSFPLVVVSGGLDFSIRHFLAQKGWLKSLKIFAPKAKCTEDGVILSFPKRFDAESTDFKEDLVRHYEAKGKKVVYIGNGLGDFSASRIADLALAIKDSQLAQLCKSSGVPCNEITDFQEAIDSIRNWTLVQDKETWVCEQ
jgi:2,3-diketo-5-methylthio-1-phosphopentane phosphatase